MTPPGNNSQVSCSWGRHLTQGHQRVQLLAKQHWGVHQHYHRNTRGLALGGFQLWANIHCCVPHHQKHSKGLMMLCQNKDFCLRSHLTDSLSLFTIWLNLHLKCCHITHITQHWKTTTTKIQITMENSFSECYMQSSWTFKALKISKFPYDFLTNFCKQH